MKPKICGYLLLTSVDEQHTTSTYPTNTFHYLATATSRNVSLDIVLGNCAACRYLLASVIWAVCCCVTVCCALADDNGPLAAALKERTLSHLEEWSGEQRPFSAKDIYFLVTEQQQSWLALFLNHIGYVLQRCALCLSASCVCVCVCVRGVVRVWKVFSRCSSQTGLPVSAVS